MSQIEDRPVQPNGAGDMWRSLREWENTPEFQELVRKEFPTAEPDKLGPVDRRRFLQLIGASAALASATSCRYEREELRPFAQRPEGYVPGDRRIYASAMERAGVALPLHVTTVDGRPIKVDGNPGHPASGGGSDAQAQASILEFYDPDRSHGVSRWKDGQRQPDDPKAVQWEKALGALRSSLAQRRGDGSGVAVLSEVTSSPTLHRLRQRFLEAFPGAKWAQWSATASDSAMEGARMASGQSDRAHLRFVCHFDRARVIFSLDNDFLGMHPDGTRHSAEFARGRRPEGEMNRLYAVESRYTQAGANADHRLPLAPAQMGTFLETLEQELGAMGLPGVQPASPASPGEAVQAFARALADDLWKARGQALLLCGDHLPAAVHARVLSLNERLGALGKTLTVIEAPQEVDAGGSAGLQDLTGAMAGGGVEVLLLLGGNPVYDAPADLGFAEALARVPFKAHLSEFVNETSRQCDWAPAEGSLSGKHGAMPAHSMGPIRWCSRRSKPSTGARVRSS